MSEDFYEVLGVSRDASEDEIERAYRKRASEYHPDVSDDPDAEEKFKRIQKAKEVLTDEEKRQAYDRLGHERFEQAEKRGGFDGGPGGGAGGMGGGNPFGGEGGFGGMNDIFEQFFGGGTGGQQGPRQGQDLRTRIRIDLEEAHGGVETEMTARRPEHCSDCDGHGHPPDADSQTCPQCDGRGRVTRIQQSPLGQVQQTQPCGRCDGEGTLYSDTCGSCGGDGVVEREATIPIDIPAGIRDGQEVRVRGEGAPGDPEARNGDLIVEVHVADHPDFERDGDDLRYQHAISFPQAVFGDTVEVPTMEGAAEFEVDPETQSGEVFRLRGKGMPRPRGRGQGDLYVRVQVVTPDPSDLDEDQREALEAFVEAGGEEIDVEQGFFEKIRNSF